jgi:DNA-binding transcriptional regulator YiaG
MPLRKQKPKVSRTSASRASKVQAKEQEAPRIEKEETSVNEAVKKLRNRMGLSQQVFSTNYLECGITSLVNYEKRWPLSMKLLMKLAGIAKKAGHMDLADYFGRRALDEIAEAAKGTPVNMLTMDIAIPFGMLFVTFTSMAERERAQRFLSEFNEWRNSEQGAAEIRESLRRAERAREKAEEAAESHHPSKQRKAS